MATATVCRRSYSVETRHDAIDILGPEFDEPKFPTGTLVLWAREKVRRRLEERS